MDRGVIVSKEIKLEDTLKARKLFEKYDSEMQVYLNYLETEKIPAFARKDIKEFIRKVQECRLHTLDTIKKYNLYIDAYLKQDEAGEA